METLLSHELVKKEIPKMPILMKMIEEFSELKPLKDLNIGFSHVIAPNTVVMIASIIAAGASLDIYTDNGIKHNEEIVEHLKKCGLNVKTTSPESTTYDFAFDCAGYFLDYPVNIGVTEVTRTGINKYNNEANKPYILIDVDSTKTKLLETFIGNPQGMLNTLRHFIEDFDSFIIGKKIAIIGFGKIGRGSARIFKEMGNNVLIFDVSKNVRIKAKKLGFETYDLSADKGVNSAPLSEVDLIITATSHYGVMTRFFDKNLISDSSLKINLGVEDEWGDDYTENEIFHSKYKPFNFNLSPPTPSNYIDPILALHVMGMTYLTKNYKNLNKEAKIIPKMYDEEIVSKFNSIYNNEGKILDNYFEL